MAYASTELCHDGAGAYERQLVTSLFADWAGVLVGLAQLRVGDRVLDVACGTGIVARTTSSALGTAGRLVGVDRDQDMLSVARTTTGGGSPAVRWIVADAARLPFDDGSFDVVFCQQGLQFLPDRVSALLEMCRVLVPGGRMAAGVWKGVQDGACGAALAAILDRHLGQAATKEMRQPCADGDAAALRTDARRAGFEHIETTVSVAHLRSASGVDLFEQAVLLTSLAPALTALDADQRLALTTEFDNSPVLRSPSGELAVPIEATVIVAQRASRPRHAPHGAASDSRR